MSNKFYAKNGTSYWKPNPAYKEQKLAMLTDGTLVIMTDLMKEGWTISNLPKDFKYTEIPPQNNEESKVEKEKCRSCNGTGETNSNVIFNVW